MDSNRFVETEFVTTGDGNARIRNLQINFPHTWSSSDMTDSNSGKGYEGKTEKTRSSMVKEGN
jgi:hypothetical protein